MSLIEFYYPQARGVAWRRPRRAWQSQPASQGRLKSWHGTTGRRTSSKAVGKAARRLELAGLAPAQPATRRDATKWTVGAAWHCWLATSQVCFFPALCLCLCEVALDWARCWWKLSAVDGKLIVASHLDSAIRQIPRGK